MLVFAVALVASALPTVSAAPPRTTPVTPLRIGITPAQRIVGTIINFTIVDVEKIIQDGYSGKLFGSLADYLMAVLWGFGLDNSIKGFASVLSQINPKDARS
jgi:hypothetical protein